MNTNAYTAPQREFIAARIAQAKREILCSVLMGTLLGSEVVPLAIKGFARLHDFCDANELGGLCDEKINLKADEIFGANQQAECTDDLNPRWFAACNEIQNAIHDWLQSGGMVDDAAFIAKTLDEEQIQCLFDDERADEARGMIEEDCGHRMAHLFPPATIARLSSFLAEVQ